MEKYLSRTTDIVKKKGFLGKGIKKNYGNKWKTSS
jgi:hypothetical protein